MDNESIKTKISQLRQKLHQWNDEYFNLQKPSVADQVYDAALFELTKLEKRYKKIAKELDKEASPTETLGSEVDVRFQKHQHKVAMLSLNKAYSFSDLTRFNKNIAKHFSNFDFYCEPKIDGLSIALHYNQGKLVLALTRGNGTEGEDVTHNVLAINAIPKTIAYQKAIEIRGEIYLDKLDFEKINADLAKENKPLYANARNLASGTMRQLDAKIVAKRNLSAFFYNIVEPEKHDFKKYSQTIAFLEQNNFPVNPFGKKIDTIEEAFEYVQYLATIKDQWGYDVDGMVIKLEQLQYYKKLGFTAKFPHSAIAYKFASEIVETKLLDIFPTIGRTGIITYNAVLEPAFIGGTIVSAATLHNYTYIEKLRISIGDVVKIYKAGEIIPKVLESVNPKTKTNYLRATHCPQCQFPLKDSETKIDQFCINIDCPEVKVKKIIYFVSIDGINVRGLAEAQIRLFFEKGFLKEIPDIFNLKTFQEEILAIKGFKEKSVNKLIEAIEEAKHVYFYKLIAGLGIKNIGEKNAKFLAKKIPKLAGFLGFDFDSLIAYDDIGPITIAELKNYFADQKNIELWKQIQILNWKWKIDPPSANDKFKGMSFVITGSLSRSRNEFKKDIEISGGTLEKVINKNIDYLIVGKNPASKLTKAQSLGIKIINEDEFWELLD